MKGKVLGADASGGTISGEDGKRYKFESAQWKSERPAQPGDEVDFDIADDGTAQDIYALRSGVTLDFSAVGGQAKALLGEHANSPMGAHILALAKGNALFQIALVILAASCLLTFVKLNSAISSLAPGAAAALPNQGVFKIINTAEVVDYAKTSLEAAAVGMDQLAQLVAQPDSSPFGQAQPTPSPFGDPKASAAKIRSAAGYVTLLYLLYLAPVGALAMIVQLVRKQSLGVIPLVTGAVCVVSFALLAFSRFALIAAVKKAANANMAELAGKAIVFGLGSYTILLCGLALLALVLGFVRLPQRAA